MLPAWYPKGPVKGDLAGERLRRAGLRRRLRRAFGGTFIVFGEFPPPGKPSFGGHKFLILLGKLDDLETQKNISRWLPWIPLGRLTLPTARVEDGLFRPCPTPLVGSEDLVVDLFPTHEYVRERR